MEIEKHKKSVSDRVQRQTETEKDSASSMERENRWMLKH